MKKQIYVYETIEQLLREYDSLPPSAVIDLRQQSKPYLHILPMEELERISACRHWGVVGLIRPDAELPDDFEPKLPPDLPPRRRPKPKKIRRGGSPASFSPAAPAAAAGPPFGPGG